MLPCAHKCPAPATHQARQAGHACELRRQVRRLHIPVSKAWVAVGVELSGKSSTWVGGSCAGPVEEIGCEATNHIHCGQSTHIKLQKLPPAHRISSDSSAGILVSGSQVWVRPTISSVPAQAERSAAGEESLLVHGEEGLLVARLNRLAGQGP